MGLSRRARLIAVWLVAAVGLGVALIAASRNRSPLDDPDLAYQRPGFLDAHHAPTPAPQVTPAIPAAGQRTVVYFTRPERAADLAATLPKRASLAERAQQVVVVSGETSVQIAGVPVVVDRDGQLAAAFMLDRPRDGGPPVGYAVVDRHGQIRYRTLDPGVAERLDEVETIVRATP